MNGNITKVRIAPDLEWIHRVGIGGFQTFDAALGTPKVLDKFLVYMTPKWKNPFLFAPHKADELGLEMEIADSSGRSESNGPWIKLNYAMRKIVWNETSVEADKPFQGVLLALLRQEPCTIQKAGE